MALTWLSEASLAVLLLLTTAALALAISLAALCTVDDAKRARRAGLLLAAGLSLALYGIGAATLVVGDFSRLASMTLDAVPRAEAAAEMLFLFVLTGPIAVIAALIFSWATFSSRFSSSVSRQASVVALSAAIVLEAGCGFFWSSRPGFHCMSTPGQRVMTQLHVMSEAQWWTGISSLALIAMFAVAFVWRLRSAERGLLNPSILFAIGLFAFVASRPMALDAHAPLQYLDGAYIEDPGVVTPQLSICTHYDSRFDDTFEYQWPVLLFGDSGVTWEGRPVQGPDELGRLLQGLRREHQLLHPNESRPQDYVVVADARRPARDLVYWLNAARHAGWERARMATWRANETETHTLGRISRGRVCAPRVATYVDYDQPGTWGELAELETRAYEQARFARIEFRALVQGVSRRN